MPLAWTRDLTLVLASASPQRRAILEQLGIAHVVRPTDAEEIDDGDPHAAAAANARAKAAAGRAALGEAERERRGGAGLRHGRRARRPRSTASRADAAQAAEYIGARSPGRTHEVLGALAVAAPDGALRERTDVTRVTFAPLTAAQIARLRRDRRMATEGGRLRDPGRRRRRSSSGSRATT